MGNDFEEFDRVVERKPLTQDQITAGVIRYGAPKRLAGLGIATMERRSEAYESTLQTIEAIGRSLETGAFIDDPVCVSIMGPFGSGKTRSAVWLQACAYRGLADHARHYLTSRWAPRFMGGTEIAALRSVGWYGDAEEEEEDHREFLFSSKFLVVDDFCRVSGYKGESLFIEGLIERRYNDMLSTVITTSSLPESLPPRIKEFLKYFDQLVLVADSFRGSGK